jgi:hypothetical protein
MLRFLAIIGIGLILLCTAFYRLANSGGLDPATNLWTWVKLYREGLRTPLFTGFLTVGSFLLTLMATILLRIKEIYDEDEYEQDWQQYQAQRLAEDPSAKPTAFYGSLRNLGTALLTNVILALFSSILQVTFGFYNSPWAVAICLGFAAMTLLLLLYLWWQIAANLSRWFDVIERKKRKKLGS